MEIIYEIASIDQLPHIECENVRWLSIPDDFELFTEHLLSREPPFVLHKDQWQRWHEDGIDYCGLILNGKMIARAAVERYSSDYWETADVRVFPSERNKGYAKRIAYFVTKYILESGHKATCRTEEDNVAMQHVIKNLGFSIRE